MNRAHSHRARSRARGSAARGSAAFFETWLRHRREGVRDQTRAAREPRGLLRPACGRRRIHRHRCCLCRRECRCARLAGSRRERSGRRLSRRSPSTSKMGLRSAPRSHDRSRAFPPRSRSSWLGPGRLFKFAKLLRLAHGNQKIAGFDAIVRGGVEAHTRLALDGEDDDAAVLADA